MIMQVYMHNPAEVIMMIKTTELVRRPVYELGCAVGLR